MLSESQYGFQCRKSTVDVVANLLDFVPNSLENIKKMMIIFLDLSKAFDCMEFDILLNKLDKVQELPLYGLNQIEVIGRLSNEVQVIFGIPQGSFYLYFILGICHHFSVPTNFYSILMTQQLWWKLNSCHY